MSMAREYSISRVWVQKLVKRYEDEGEAALYPRSRRPLTHPNAVDAEVEDHILRLRKTLTRRGLDAGAETIVAHLAPLLAGTENSVPAVSTVWRVLTRRGFITPQPQKRPRSSWQRFEADQPNERWQADVTHWRLTTDTTTDTATATATFADVEILNLIDDHSRLNIASTARTITRGPDVVATFTAAFARWGAPAEVLTDNGAIFTAKQRGQGRVALEIELGLRGINISHSRPYHPQTCGKVERFHQTQKKWLAAQQPAATITALQAQLDEFADYYNSVRPHRALHRRTPAQAFDARPKAIPTGPLIPAHYRVRNDTIDRWGSVTLRHHGRLHHIGLGARRAGSPVTMLILDLKIRIIHRHTDELIRDLTLDPTRDYQPRGLKPGPPKQPRNATMSRDTR